MLCFLITYFTLAVVFASIVLIQRRKELMTQDRKDVFILAALTGFGFPLAFKGIVNEVILKGQVFYQWYVIKTTK